MMRMRMRNGIPSLPAKRVQAAEAFALCRLGSGIPNAIRNGGCLIITITLPRTAAQLEQRQQRSQQHEDREESCGKERENQLGKLQ